MSDVELWRAAVSTLATASFAVNVSLVVAVTRHRHERIAAAVWTAYALAAAGTNLVSVYFRLSDEGKDLPLNVGDFTILVPTIGFLTAGILAWRYLGRIIGRHSIDF